MFFGHGLILVNGGELLNPCGSLICFAGMAFVQTEQLEAPGKGEEEDRGREERSEVKVQLASEFQPNCIPRWFHDFCFSDGA